VPRDDDDLLDRLNPADPADLGPDAGPPPSAAETRAMLRNVSAYRAVLAQVRRSSYYSFFFGAFFLFLWWYLLPQKMQFGAFGLIYLGLGVLEFTVGLVNLVNPSLEGILFDGFVLMVFGAQSAARQLIEGNPSPFMLLSVYWVYSGFQRCRGYFQIRKAFPIRPTSANLRWFEDMIRDVRGADPAADPAALDLPCKPPIRAKLLGENVFLVASGANDLIVLAAGEFALEILPPVNDSREHQGVLFLEGVAPKPFPLDEYNLANYLDWRKSLAGG
jgi:hypothetical protein